MDFEKLKVWLRDGGWMNVAAGAVAVVVALTVFWLAWPQIKPKPKPQPQSLSTVVPAEQPDTESGTKQQAVPKDVVETILQELSADPETTSIHWAQGEEGKTIVVRLQRAALQWEEVTYVQRDGAWVQK